MLIDGQLTKFSGREWNRTVLILPESLAYLRITIPLEILPSLASAK